MNAYLVQAKYTVTSTLPGHIKKTVAREFLSNGANEQEAEGKVKHLLESSGVWEDLSMKSVEISFPYEIF